MRRTFIYLSAFLVIIALFYTVDRYNLATKGVKKIKKTLYRSSKPSPKPSPTPSNLVTIDSLRTIEIQKEYAQQKHTLQDPFVKLNPYGRTPLTALLQFESQEPLQVTIRIKHYYQDTYTSYTFEGFHTQHSYPLVGLYPRIAHKQEELHNQPNYKSSKILFKNIENTIILEGKNSVGEIITHTILLKTEILSPRLPAIHIEKANTKQMEKGWNLASYGIDSRGFPFLFDSEGYIRYYMHDPAIFGMWAVRQNQAGNWYTASDNNFFELDLLGRVIHQFSYDPNIIFHHDFRQMDNGNYLLNARASEDKNKIYGDDLVLEIAPDNGDIVQKWNMSEILDSTRYINVGRYLRQDDWFHLNSAIYDSSDSTIIVSGRYHGTVKIDRKNQVKWILTTPYALDSGKRYNEMKTHYLHAEDPHFIYPKGQHSPVILPNGDLLLYDNIGERIDKGKGKSLNQSAAVIYRIDEKNKQVKEMWQYGREQKEALFSYVVSTAQYLPKTQHILMMSGAVQHQYNKAIYTEIVPHTRQEVFQAHIYFDEQDLKWGGNIIFVGERLNLFDKSPFINSQ